MRPSIIKMGNHFISSLFFNVFTIIFQIVLYKCYEKRFGNKDTYKNDL